MNGRYSKRPNLYNEGTVWWGGTILYNKKTKQRGDYTMSGLYSTYMVSAAMTYLWFCNKDDFFPK